jgi:aspartate aminotransferase
MSFFEKIETAPPDPILGLTVAFKEDPRKQKVNLGVGAYKTDDLQPLVMAAVRQAEERVLKSGADHEYQPIEGHAEFLRLARELVFAGTVPPERVFAAQTPGGTGGLRVAAELIYNCVTKNIFVSDPTWPNHNQIFAQVGLKIENYPYWDAAKKSLRFAEMCAAIDRAAAGSAVLLHASCHNPTGLDPTAEEWKELSGRVKARGLMPLLDFAYQGFGRGLDEDAAGVRQFARDGHAMAVVWSASKNFGLYGERLGALFVVAESADGAARAGSQAKRLIRANYSNPPAHGARIVATALGAADLRKSWEAELAAMRSRINGMRRELAERLKKGGSPIDFSFMLRQNGMFSYSGLSKEQVERLKKEHGIYMPANGRINVAGLSPKNLDYAVKAMLSVIG